MRQLSTLLTASNPPRRHVEVAQFGRTRTAGSETQPSFTLGDRMISNFFFFSYVTRFLPSARKPRRSFRDGTLVSSNAGERQRASERAGGRKKRDDRRHVSAYRLSSSRISWIPGWNESTNRLELLEEPWEL